MSSSFQQVAFALVLTLSTASSVLACSCIPPPDLGNCVVQDEQAALLVTITDREDFECSDFSGSFVAEATIDKVFKDNTGLDLEVGESVSISSSLFGNLCGYSLDEDSQYIVFARATGVEEVDEDVDEDEAEDDKSTTTVEVSDGTSKTSVTGTSTGGKGKFRATVRAGDASETASTSTRKLQKLKKRIEIPTDPIEIEEDDEDDVCGPDGEEPQGVLSTNLCSGNVFNPTKQQIKELHVGCSALKWKW